MSTPVDERDLLAQKLRRCYEYERDRAGRTLGRGGFRLPPFWREDAGRGESRRPSVWHRLAVACGTSRIDPVRYVQWAVAVRQAGLGRPPEPTQLHDRARIAAFVADRPDREAEVARRLTNDSRSLQRGVTLGELHFDRVRALAAALSDTHSEVSPLLRFLAARAVAGEEFEAIADRFHQPALLQFQREPDLYAESWREMCIPAGFAGLADWLYDRVLEQLP
jgi:hypothetical protein